MRTLNKLIAMALLFVFCFEFSAMNTQALEAGPPDSADAAVVTFKIKQNSIGCAMILPNGSAAFQTTISVPIVSPPSWGNLLPRLRVDDGFTFIGWYDAVHDQTYASDSLPAPTEPGLYEYEGLYEKDKTKWVNVTFKTSQGGRLLLDIGINPSGDELMKLGTSVTYNLLKGRTLLNSVIYIPIPLAKDHYHFDNWYDESGNPAYPVYVPDTDSVYTAVFVPDEGGPWEPDERDFVLTVTKLRQGYSASLTHNTQDMANFSLLIALYDGDTLVRSFRKTMVYSGSFAFTTYFPSFDGDVAYKGYTYKVFAWDGASYIPLTAPFETQLGARSKT